MLDVLNNHCSTHHGTAVYPKSSGQCLIQVPYIVTKVSLTTNSHGNASNISLRLFAPLFHPLSLAYPLPPPYPLSSFAANPRLLIALPGILSDQSSGQCSSFFILMKDSSTTPFVSLPPSAPYKCVHIPEC